MVIDLTKHDVIDAALHALTIARERWEDGVVLTACRSFSSTASAFARLLAIFHDPSRQLERARHEFLHLLLLLVSAGCFIPELKKADIRGAIENNEHIAANDKPVTISILSLLGYNADLNAEFARALDRFESDRDAAARSESLGYIVHFLQLYTLTDERLQGRAINCFMSCLTHAMATCSIVTANNMTSKERAHWGEESSSSEFTTEIDPAVPDYLFCLHKFAQSRRFADLYVEQWRVNALLGVALTRTRLHEAKRVLERAALTTPQILDLLELSARLASSLPPQSAQGELSDVVWLNAMVIIDDWARDDNRSDSMKTAIDILLTVFVWASQNDESFDMLCRHAGELRAVLRILPSCSEHGHTALMALLDALTRRVAQIEWLNDLLTSLLDSIYQHAVTLPNAIREKLLVYILLILKRMGDEGLTATRVYEHSLQQIVSNVQHGTELVARCSWDLLGVLCELDASIGALFNLGAFQILLLEFCATATSSSVAASSSTSHKDGRIAAVPPPASTGAPRGRAPRLASRTSSTNALDKGTAVLSESHYRRMEALKCLSKAVRSHDEVLQKVGETAGIAAHLFRALVGHGAGGPTETNALNQEHAAHVIARLASQEFFKASLLSQEQITTLIDSLESVHPTIVLYALESLFHLSEFSMCLDALVRHATVPVLAQILASPLIAEDAIRLRSVERCVVGLLANMCAKNKVIGRRVVSSHLLPRLRHFLITDEVSAAHMTASVSQEIQYFAIWTIKSVSKDPELVGKLHEQQILETMVDHLASYEPLKTQRKAFGALSNMIIHYRPGAAFPDEQALAALTETLVECMHRLVVMVDAQNSLARALTVLEAIASLGQADKDMLCEQQGVVMAIQLLDALDAHVKLKALQVVLRWVEDNTNFEQLQEVFTEAPLLSLVRAISEEPDDSLLIALQLLNLLLNLDDAFRNKLTGMTNEMLLRLVATIVRTASPGAIGLAGFQVRVLGETLKALVAMTKGGKPSIATPSVIMDSLNQLVDLLAHPPNESIRLNTLYLLVNFASAMELRPRMVENGTLHTLVSMLTGKSSNQSAQRDDKILQLCLLGVALLTAVDFHSATPALLEAIDDILTCLKSKNAAVQANAVWVVSNVSGEGRHVDVLGLLSMPRRYSWSNLYVCGRNRELESSDY
ncbi:hypothetical protein PINS_up013792 [Pythium insidiosum]|nr:hypothetical protein PINS_up013792 [Pythium insidiosum]